jgi:uncharacterized protein YrrD
MLMNTSHLNGLTVRATDGDLGTVDQCYFDDKTWAIRYLTVDTGGWFFGKRVLISPHSITLADWVNKRLDVALTKLQVKNSPDIDTHKPISRQHEISYLDYYGYPYYWSGPFLWGPALYPAGSGTLTGALMQSVPPSARRETSDSHLRSSNEVKGYHIEASDGEIGHVEAFIMDDQAWAIRYIELETANWWPGKKVIVSPEWIERVSWATHTVYVGLTRQAVKDGPEYREPVTREYEDQLHRHHGRPAYWDREVKEQSSSVGGLWL